MSVAPLIDLDNRIDLPHKREAPEETNGACGWGLSTRVSTLVSGGGRWGLAHENKERVDIISTSSLDCVHADTRSQVHSLGLSKITT